MNYLITSKGKIGLINSTIKGLRIVQKEEATEEQAHKIIDAVLLKSIITKENSEIKEYCKKHYNY